MSKQKTKTRKEWVVVVVGKDGYTSLASIYNGQDRGHIRFTKEESATMLAESLKRGGEYLCVQKVCLRVKEQKEIAAVWQVTYDIPATKESPNDR